MLPGIPSNLTGIVSTVHALPDKVSFKDVVCQNKFCDFLLLMQTIFKDFIHYFSTTICSAFYRNVSGINLNEQHHALSLFHYISLMNFSKISREYRVNLLLQLNNLTVKMNKCIPDNMSLTNLAGDCPRDIQRQKVND